MESISFQYPSWYIILCVLLGLAFAMMLYFRDKTFREQSRQLNLFLGGIRFLSVTLISILLLSPLLKSLLTEAKKPLVVLAQDQSESVGSEMSEEDKASYQQAFEDLQSELASEYDLITYSFGEEVREGADFTFADKVTNISEMLTGIYDLHSNQNLGAVILATDGIYNEGSNPVYTNAKLSAPIYTVALGDTTPQRDVVLKRVFHNKIAYLGDKFSIQVDIGAKNCNGSATQLTVSKVENGNTQRLQQFPVRIDKEDFFMTQEVILDADKAGVQRYRISVGQVQGEVTAVNNRKDIFIDVLDARQKILILANSPHPDVTALRQSLSKNKNYEVTVAYESEFREDPAAFDFVIFHQLPGINRTGARVLMAVGQQKIPRLFIAGTQTNYNTLNQAQNLVNFRVDGRNTNEVQGRVAGDFSLFNIDTELAERLINFAPLTAPFGEFQTSEEAQVLLYQRIGKIDTRFPLIVLGEQDGARVGVICAEGLWKWRLFDYLQHENHNIFEELMGKTVQYVSLKEDKRKFRVSTDKNIFSENEAIIFDAELYNESYELINDPDVSMVIRSSDGKEFPFTFDKTNQAYTLNANAFPVGNYTYQATVSSSGEVLTYNGQFSVEPIQLEVYETTADHGMLRLLSEKYGGQMISPAELGTLPGMIAEKGTVKPIIYETTRNRSVINLKWIFLVLAVLLTLEWFLRRYFGGY